MRNLVPAAAGAALALAAAASALAAALPPPGQVTFVAGEATRSAGGKTEKLAVGSAVFENDTLETKGRTRLEITLRDQSVVRVGPRSKVTISAAVFGRAVEDRKVAARLVVGDVWAKVARAVGGDARFEVQTANAVAGVRGTTFRVDARADKSLVVKVYGAPWPGRERAVPGPPTRARSREGRGRGSRSPARRR
jgi:hypothetical protein